MHTSSCATCNFNRATSAPRSPVHAAGLLLVSRLQAAGSALRRSAVGEQLFFFPGRLATSVPSARLWHVSGAFAAVNVLVS